MLHKIDTLLLVLGGMALVIAAIFALMLVLRQEHMRPVLLRFTLGYGIAGLALMLVRLFALVLPERRRQQKYQHPHAKRRLFRTPSMPQPHPAPPRDLARQGGVLVLVLILLGLIAGLCLQAQVHARLLSKRAESEVSEARLRQSATDAALFALQRLADDEDLLFDSTNEAWSAAYETVDPLGVATRVRIVDENRHFDLNNLTLDPTPSVRPAVEILKDIMTLCGDFTPSVPANALADWVDAGGDGARETPYYRELDPPYSAPNRMLYAWNEILMAAGWDRSRFERKGRESLREAFSGNLLDCVTLLPVSRNQPLPVNINTAPREVLEGIFGIGNQAITDTILAMRTTGSLRSLEPLALVGDAGFFESVRPYLALRSGHFAIEAQAYRDDRSQVVRLLAQRDTSGRVRVLQWLM